MLAQQQTKCNVSNSQVHFETWRTLKTQHHRNKNICFRESVFLQCLGAPSSNNHTKGKLNSWAQQYKLSRGNFWTLYPAVPHVSGPEITFSDNSPADSIQSVSQLSFASNYCISKTVLADKMTESVGKLGIHRKWKPKPTRQPFKLPQPFSVNPLQHCVLRTLFIALISDLSYHFGPVLLLLCPYSVTVLNLPDQLANKLISFDCYPLGVATANHLFPSGWQTRLGPPRHWNLICGDLTCDQ